MLHILDHIPGALPELEAKRLHEVLPGPTLIHLEGRRAETLFASVLLHGNETTGWEAMRRLLARYQRETLPRSLSVLIGNVEAARYGYRRLDDQPDFNRIWKGGDDPEHGMARRILDEMRARRLFASVDVHNTSGLNPHYASLNRLEPSYLHLATLFGRTVVYFRTPDTVQSMAFAALCPAVTVECGQPGQEHGVAHALEFLEACMNISHLPDTPVPAHDIDLFHTVAVVKVPEHVTIATDSEAGDIRFVGDLDQLNFRELPPGTTLAWTRRDREVLFEAWDEQGNEVGRRYFCARDGEITTTLPVVPAMLTLDTRIIRQDCFCYLMERYQL